MLSKKGLVLLALPVSLSSAFAKVEIIPPAINDIKAIEQIKGGLILKNAKGTWIQKSFSLSAPDNWFNLSPEHSVEGLRSEETYSNFGMPVSEDIIVAVIDSGVDVNHEDLQGKVWINQGEIANNGIDDDNNGYVDDVFGWNFIGGSNGMATIEIDNSLGNGIRLIKGNPSAQVDADTLEVTRELVRMKKLKERLQELGEELSSAQESYLASVEKIVTEKFKEADSTVKDYKEKLVLYKKSELILKTAGLAVISIEAVRNFESQESTVLDAKREMLKLLSNGLSEGRINRVLNFYKDQVEYYYNQDFNSRLIVGDNYTNSSEKFYGNNDVIGPDSSHGTHVAGIIAAVRDNALGMKGVATNVKIMALRAVPNGDERDKDVANSIRYAVDNGAKIINMSFGKGHSPYKKVVDEAVRYAEEKGVLLVHAAGNDNKNIDFNANFPNKRDVTQGSREFSNWLEIGASSFKKGLSLPAQFSNFGKKSVDLFAPGVDIYSTTPDNGYDTYSGTSMASPAAAGAAALALSYAPEMDANSLRFLLIDTSRRYPRLNVYLPGTKKEVLFSSLSTYGSIVDVYSAVNAVK